MAKHDTIILDNSNVAALGTFYRFSRRALGHKELLSEFVKEEFRDAWLVGQQVLKEGTDRGEAGRILGKAIPAFTEKTLGDGMAVLRRQLLEAAFSILENFLCHVVRVYYHTFPYVLKASGRYLTFPEIVDLPEGMTAFDVAVEKEVNSFNRLSLEKKKGYMAKRFKITDDWLVWAQRGKELWRELDHVRQDIVHGENPPEVTEEFLTECLSYVFYVCFMTAILSQAKHGVPFRWYGASGSQMGIILRDPPSLSPQK